MTRVMLFGDDVAATVGWVSTVMTVLAALGGATYTLLKWWEKQTDKRRKWEADKEERKRTDEREQRDHEIKIAKDRAEVERQQYESRKAHETNLVSEMGKLSSKIEQSIAAKHRQVRDDFKDHREEEEEAHSKITADLKELRHHIMNLKMGLEMHLGIVAAKVAGVPANTESKDTR